MRSDIRDTMLDKVKIISFLIISGTGFLSEAIYDKSIAGDRDIKKQLNWCKV